MIVRDEHVLGALFACLATMAPSAAHVQVAGHNSFYFSGTTYQVSQATGIATTEDPVNLMVVEDAQAGTPATDANVAAALKGQLDRSALPNV